MIELKVSSPLLGDPVTFAQWVKGALDSVVELNRQTLRRYPNIPRIYSSGVVFQPEPPGYDSIVDIPEVLLRLFGDCAHVGAWKLAELVERDGEPLHQGDDRPGASLRITWIVKRPRPGLRKRLFHVQITRADGKVEDPSVMLGMVPNLDFPPDEPFYPDVLGAPVWAKSHAIWRKAERAIKPRWHEYEYPYAAVSHVYKKMGGVVA